MIPVPIRKARGLSLSWLSPPHLLTLSLSLLPLSLSPSFFRVAHRSLWFPFVFCLRLWVYSLLEHHFYIKEMKMKYKWSPSRSFSICEHYTICSLLLAPNITGSDNSGWKCCGHEHRLKECSGQPSWIPTGKALAKESVWMSGARHQGLPGLSSSAHGCISCQVLNDEVSGRTTEPQGWQVWPNPADTSISQKTKDSGKNRRLTDLSMSKDPQPPSLGIESQSLCHRRVRAEPKATYTVVIKM